MNRYERLGFAVTLMFIGATIMFAIAASVVIVVNMFDPNPPIENMAVCLLLSIIGSMCGFIIG